MPLDTIQHHMLLTLEICRKIKCMYHLIYYNFRHFVSFSFEMASKITIEAVKHNTEIAKRTIVELRNEVSLVMVAFPSVSEYISNFS